MAFGEAHKIVGGHPSLGSWDANAAPIMKWNDGNVGTLDVDFPTGQGLEFKVSTATLYPDPLYLAQIKHFEDSCNISAAGIAAYLFLVPMHDGWRLAMVLDVRATALSGL